MNRNSTVILFAILLIALVLRLMAVGWWEARLGDRDFEFGDSESYWHLAERISKSEPYQFGSGRAKVFRTPGYPIILSAIFLTSENPSPTSARILNSFFGTLTCLLIFLLGRKLFDVRTGLIAAAICAVYPGAIGMSVFVLSEGPFCPVAVLNILFWVYAYESNNRKTIILLASLGGLAAGLAILIRPSWLLFVPFSGACMLVLDRRRQQTIAITLLSLIVICAAMSPWWVRNYQVTGHFIVTTLQTGPSLYDGLNPHNQTGRSDMSKMPQLRADFETRNGAFDEYEFNREVTSTTIDFARNNPERVVSLAGKKIVRVWNPWPNAQQMNSALFKFITALGYVPILILGLWGAVRHLTPASKQLKTTCWLLMMPAIYFTALHSIFVGSIRYRQPAMLFLVILAAAILSAIPFPKRSSLQGTDQKRD